MKCPFCRTNETDVFNSRTTKFGAQIWRRRRCRTCGHAFTTYESADLRFLRVKHPGAKNSVGYDRAILYASIATAFSDATQTTSDIGAITDTVESKILDLQELEVASDKITSIVLSTLERFNTAAFLHYLALHAPLRSTVALRQTLKRYK